MCEASEMRATGGNADGALTVDCMIRTYAAYCLNGRSAAHKPLWNGRVSRNRRRAAIEASHRLMLQETACNVMPETAAVSANGQTALPPLRHPADGAVPGRSLKVSCSS